MNKMNVNEKLISLWKKYYVEHPDDIKEEMKLVPMFYNESEYTPIKEIKVLSVGFNPSYVEDNYLNKKKVNEKLTEMHKWGNFVKEENVEEILKIDMALRSKVEGLEHLFYNKYFKPLNEFYDNIEIFKKNTVQKSHIDLFFIRGTDMKKAKELLVGKEKKVGYGKKYILLTDFAKEQLKVFKKMLDKYDPTIIFIFSALSSHIFLQEKDFLGGDQQIKDDGFYHYNGVPVILGPMLTNGVMDMISRNRLLWQINKFFNAA